MSAVGPPPGGRAPPVPRIVVGSRRSWLAREQARRVGRRIETAWPGIEVAYATLTTEGDRVLDRPLPEVGGKGLFTAELEAALRAGEVDLAVHSLKDLPTAPAAGLALLAVPEREDPRDVLVSPRGGRLEALEEGTVVGTSSLRRAALLLRSRPDCRIAAIRGNVETRLRKLDDGEYGALVLAAAGLERLGLLRARRRAGEAGFLEPPAWLPAPGQGALAVQGRSEDDPVRRTLAAVDDRDARAAVTAERAFLAGLGGGCRVPIGAWARRDGEEVVLRGVVLSADGGEAMEGTARSPAGEPEEAGRSLAEELRGRGVMRLLEGAPG